MFIKGDAERFDKVHVFLAVNGGGEGFVLPLLFDRFEFDIAQIPIRADVGAGQQEAAQLIAGQ